MQLQPTTGKPLGIGQVIQQSKSCQATQSLSTGSAQYELLQPHKARNVDRTPKLNYPERILINSGANLWINLLERTRVVHSPMNPHCKAAGPPSPQNFIGLSATLPAWFTRIHSMEQAVHWKKAQAAEAFGCSTMGLTTAPSSSCRKIFRASSSSRAWCWLSNFPR